MVIPLTASSTSLSSNQLEHVGNLAVSGCEWDIRMFGRSSGLGDGEFVNLVIVVLSMGKGLLPSWVVLYS